MGILRIVCPSSLPSTEPSTGSSKKKRKRSELPTGDEHQRPPQKLALSLSYRMLNDAERDALEREEGANGFGDEDDGEGGESSFDGDRWLSVGGVPASYDYADVAAALSCFGEVGQCLFRPRGETLSESRSFGRTVFVEFDDPESVSAASSVSAKTIEQPFDGRGNHPVGMRKWLSEYTSHRPNADRLQKQVDAFMAAFDAREKKEAELLAEPEVDEDGFTLVRRKGSRRPAAATSSSSTSSSSGGRERRRLVHRLQLGGGLTNAHTSDSGGGDDGGLTSSVQLGDDRATKRQKKARKASEVGASFYNITKRDSRQKQVALLREKFEDDRKRIAKMRAERKFRPFD